MALTYPLSYTQFLGALRVAEVTFRLSDPQEHTRLGDGTVISASLGGGICSNLAAGWLIDHVGPAAPQIYGGIGAMLLLLVAPFLVPEVTPREAD